MKIDHISGLNLYPGDRLVKESKIGINRDQPKTDVICQKNLLSVDHTSGLECI